MKKIIFIILALLFILGCSSEQVTCNKPYLLVGNSCCLDENSDNICDKDEKKTADNVITGNGVKLPEPKEPQKPEEVKGEPKIEVSQQETEMVTGDEIIYNGKEIKLISVDSYVNTIEFVVEVDGVERAIYGTKTLEIVQGIEVTPLKVNLMDRKATLRLNVLELGSNEYLMDTNKNIFVDGKEVKLRNVMDDEAILVDIIDKTLKIRIREGHTETVEGLNITNVNAFFRNSLDERYAIVKVIKA